MGVGSDPYTSKVDIFLDLENALPSSDEERQVYDTINQALTKGPHLLSALKNYRSCEDVIKKAISTPGPETEEAAWASVLPAVEQLKEFYDFSIELQSCFPKLLIALCKANPKENLSSQQALAKQVATVLDFVLRFDDLKLGNPAIQNDFSYYRRTLNRKKITKDKKQDNLTIRDELANRMSLFFAYPTPMMNAIVETTFKFLSQDSSIPSNNVTEALATMANVCLEMIVQKKFEKLETNLFCLRTMTGSIILFDHLHQSGAFNKKSPINIRGCIMQIKALNGNGETNGLLNAIRFTTTHLNDADTPPTIKQLLE